MAEAINQAIGPIFHANPDYKTICEAIALTVARISQSTPAKGNEYKEMEEIFNLANHALEQFLNEEERQLEAKSKIIQRNIESFSEIVRGDGRDESEVTDKKFHENSGLNPKLYGPHNGLAAINGGVSPEACAKAQKFAERFYDDKSRLTEEGFEQLKKDIVALHTPDPEEASWSNSPIHQEIERFEHENQDLKPNCCRTSHNPDGPRAYI